MQGEKNDEEEDSSDECFNSNININHNSDQPLYSPNVWMLSVRPVRKLTKFSHLNFLFQPDLFHFGYC